MAFMQGKPDGTPQHPHPVYPIHFRDNRHDVIQRDKELGNKLSRAICGNGGYHMWLTNDTNEVTCLACKAYLGIGN